MPLTRDEEAALVLECRSDSERASLAFSRIFQEYDGQLRGYLRGRCRNDRDADEIRQEAWLRFSKALPRFNPQRAPIIAVLKKKAAYAAIDYYRVGTLARGSTVFIEDLRLLRDRWGADDEPDDGAEPYPGVDSLVDWETRESFLRISYQELERPAHELLVYGFHMYLEWMPRELVEETFASRSLDGLMEQFIDDFASAYEVSTDRLEPIFAPFRRTVSAPEIGRLRLADCFRTVPPEEDIRRWSYGVFSATVRAARRALAAAAAGQSR